MATFNKVILRGYFETALTLREELNAKITLKTPDGVIIDTDDGRVRLPETQSFTAAQLKAGLVEIAATDDVNANPAQWFYYLTEDWEGGRKAQPIIIPSDAPVDSVSGKPTWDYWKLASAASTGNIVVPTIVRTVNGVAPDEQGAIVIPIGSGGGGGGTGDPAPPTGPAGGVLGGTYPDPGFAVNMATQAELDGAFAAALHPRGPYVGGTQYAANDVVIYKKLLPGSTTVFEPGGRSYRCISAHTAAATLDFTKWEELGQQTSLSDARYFAAPWAPNTSYAQFQPALRADGAYIQAKSAFITGSVYDGTNWTYIAGGPATAATTLELPQTKTSSYILALTDAGKVLEVDSASNASITLPPHSETPIPIGSSLRVRQIGSTPVIVATGAGVTLQTKSTNRTAGPLSQMRLYKRGAYDWVVDGDLQESPIPPRVPSTAASVTFNSADHVIDPLRMFSMAVTAYGDVTNPTGDIRTNTALQQSVKDLGPGTYRFGLKWDALANRPYAGANSALNDSTGADAWVAGIQASMVTGAKIIGLLEGTDGEMRVTPEDATSIVQYAVAHSWPVEAWIVGNEPELSGSTKTDYLDRPTASGVTYADLFCRIVAAVKAAVPTAKFLGPASSQFNGRFRADPATATSPGTAAQFLNDFLNGSGAGTTVAAHLDGMCWHKYLSGGSGVDVSTAALMAKTTDHYNDVLAAKALVAAYSAYASKVSTFIYAVNEWNLFFQPNNGRNGVRDEQGTWYDERVITAEGTVFIASALRNSCRTTLHRLTYFGDKAGPLGLWTRNPYDLTATPPKLGDNMGTGGLIHYPHGKPVHTPYPPYYGIGMYTGLGLFRRFGANIPVIPGHGITNLEIIASTDNGGDVVLVNKDETTTRRLNLKTTGIGSGSVEVWQTSRTAPWDLPKRLAVTNIVTTTLAQTTPTVVVVEGTIFDLVLPPMTVTRLVIS